MTKKTRLYAGNFYISFSWLPTYRCRLLITSIDSVTCYCLREENLQIFLTVCVISGSAGVTDVRAVSTRPALHTTYIQRCTDGEPDVPDGSRQVVSVPKLYARVRPGDLQGGGTLLAGNAVRINTADKVLNSGSINGRDLTAISAGSLLNTGDISGNNTQLVATREVSACGSLLMQAGRDMNLRAADVTATGDVMLLAGNNLNLTGGEAVWDRSTSAKWNTPEFISARRIC